MAKPIRMIEVVPNPYAGIGSGGVPQGVVQMPGSSNYVGAMVDQTLSHQDNEDRGCFYYPGFPSTTFKVPLTPETARAVLDGALIATNEKDASACGISSFLAADKALEAEKAAALDTYQAHYGKDAQLAPVPTAPNADAPAVDMSKPRRVMQNLTIKPASEA